MKQATNLYRQLREQTGSYYEVRIIRGNTTYGMDRLKSIRISQALFQDSGPQVGGVNSSKCVVELKETSTNWPRMASFQVMVRIVSDSGQADNTWLSFGTFFTDERKADQYGNLRIVAYDAMLKMEQSWTDKIINAPSNWPITSKKAAQLLVEATNIQFEDINALDNSVHYIGFDTSVTARDALKSIAVGNGGSWYVTPNGKFRLVRLVNAEIENIPAIVGAAVAGISVVGDSTYQAVDGDIELIQVGMAVKSLESNTPTDEITGVEVESDTGVVAFAGSREGYVLKTQCGFATTAIASLCLGKVRGFVYRPFEAKSARLDPVAEIGDYAVIANTAYPIVTLDWNVAKKIVADISAPWEEEVEHEYKTLSETAKQYKKIVSATDGKLKDYVKVTEMKTAIEQSESAINLQASTTFVSKLDFQQLADQVDGAIETWSGDAVPTLGTLPASNWNTNALKDEHIGDLYFVNGTSSEPEAGYCYRFEKNNGTYVWTHVDTAITRALAKAQDAIDIANDAQLLVEDVEGAVAKKARIYTVQPTGPYSVGDLWFDGSQILVCKRARTIGYSALDWEKKDGYIDADQAQTIVTAQLNVAADSITATVEENVISALAEDFLTTEGGTNTSFGWELTSTEHAWFANNRKVMSVNEDGLYVEGEIRASTGYIGNASTGFEITSSSIRNGMESFIDDEHNGVYIGTNGIALGAGAFTVSSSGAVNASNISITGGTITIRDQDDNIAFSVSSNGTLYASSGTFNGTVYADNLVDLATNQGVYTAIKNAIDYATKYNNATQSGTVTYSNYFTAGTIVAKNSFYSHEYTVNTGNDITDFDLVEHYHSIVLNNNTGVVTLGAPIKNSGVAPSFNIANTTYYQNAVLAERTSGANSVEIKSNANNGIISISNPGSWDREVNISDSNKTAYSPTGNMLYGYVNIALTNDRTYSARVGITAANVQSVISSLKIYTPDDDDNPNTPRSGYNEQYFTVEANDRADNYIRVFYEYDSTKYNIWYELNALNGNAALKLFELDRTGGGGGSSIDIYDVRLSLSQASNVSDSFYTSVTMTSGSLTYDSNNDQLVGYANASLDTGQNTESDSRRVKIIMSASKKPSGTAITSTYVNRETENGRYKEAYKRNNDWFIDVRPSVNNNAYDTVALDVTDVYTKGYDANPGTVGAWRIRERFPVATELIPLDEDMMDVDLTGDYVERNSSTGNLYGYIQIGHGTYSKYLFINVDTSKVPTSGGGGETQYRIVDSSSYVPNSYYSELTLTYNAGSNQTITLPRVYNSFTGEFGSAYELGYSVGYNAAGGGGSASHSPDCRKEFMGSQYTIYISSDEYFEAYRITPTCGGEDGTPFYAYLYHSP